MNFGALVKKEIIGKPIKENCCKRAFLAGYIRGSGAITEEDGKVGLIFYVHGEEAAAYIETLLSDVFGVVYREVSVYNDRLNNRDKFCLSVSGEKAKTILGELGILIENRAGEYSVSLRIFDKVAEKECCLHAFFRGLFLASGSCSVPSEMTSAKTGFHAELTFSHSTPALLAGEKLLSCGVKTKITRRKGFFVVYIKSEEEIKNFIAFLQAPKMVLKLTDMIIERELSNKSNRQTNCDIGNVNRQIEATEKQIAAINAIIKEKGWDFLKDDLKVTAKARLDYKGDTLSELAERLNISKSCLNHRLRKIVSVAEQLKNK